MVVKMFGKVIPKEDFTEEELIKIVPTGLHYLIADNYVIVGYHVGTIEEQVFSTEDISLSFFYYDGLRKIQWDSRLAKYEPRRAYIQGTSITHIK